MLGTLIVASGEEDGGGVVADKALGDASLAEVLRGSAALLQDLVGGQDLGDQCVTARSWFQLIHFHEHRLSLFRSARAPLFLLLRLNRLH